ncbi:MAG: glycosyltransferase family 39 protein [Candidatus Binatus sp.]|uniref:glycosyltransferase family 39 protein n=1 Tax=Candidatus Binatus sp. TaxID=2811406 RepID=UPI00271AFFD9|nr:glycosyltransferase family 39 protein [Candidatus Binatus sp.]MDO8434982.1 glycosyltransferase family 39 protein [Candidatus Binatus sp.]
MSEIAITPAAATASDSQSGVSSSQSFPIAYDVAAILALSIAVFFFHLGSYGLWEPDEGRYAEIAREMLRGGSKIIPHLNYVAYVEKPPLLYWLTTLSFAVFGLTEFAARFTVAMSALAGVLATYFFALRTFGRRHAILASAILATTPIYAVMAQVLTTDMLLTALVTIANFALFLHWRGDAGSRWCWIAYAAMGLAVLAKGPVGVALPILSMLAFLAWRGELRGALGKFRAFAGLAITVAIALPWFVAITIMEPGFFDFYFVGEHLRRIFDSSYSHTEPIYFYLPVLALGLIPWSMLVPFMTWRDAQKNPARTFCLTAAMVTLVAFSCASAKLIPYILPAIPPLAILIADGLISCAWPAPDSRAAHRPPDSRILLESGPLLMLFGAGVIVAAILAPQFRTPYVMAARPAMFLIGAVLLIGGGVTTAIFLRRRRGAGLVALTLTLASALIAGGWVRLETESLRSYASLARAVAARAPDARLICYHRYVQSLAFYTGRRVILVGPKSELDFGARHAADTADWFFNNDLQLLELWERPGSTVLVIDAPELARLKERLGAFDLIASEGKKRAILRHRLSASTAAATDLLGARYPTRASRLIN